MPNSTGVYMVHPYGRAVLSGGRNEQRSMIRCTSIVRTDTLKSASSLRATDVAFPFLVFPRFARPNAVSFVPRTCPVTIAVRSRRGTAEPQRRAATHGWPETSRRRQLRCPCRFKKEKTQRHHQHQLPRSSWRLGALGPGAENPALRRMVE
jgi:hypothetical protein